MEEIRIGLITFSLDLLFLIYKGQYETWIARIRK